MLISFEGLDGSGKSTQIERFKKRLESAGMTVHVVREPGGTPVSEHIRSILLDASLTIDPFAELLLFSAARAQLVAGRVRPLLDSGDVVICDRFFDSSTAYQGGGRQLADLDWLQGFHRRVTGGLVPDRTYLLRMPASGAEHRQTLREGAADRMERSGSDFFDRVAAAYDQIAASEPERVTVIDASGSRLDVSHAIWADFRQLLAVQGAGIGTGVDTPGTEG